VIYRWVYVSRCLVPAADVDEAIRQIVSWSLGRNRELGVTGALVCSASRFAQYLEGERESVLALKRSISSDERHSGLLAIHEGIVDRRLFPDWSLLYAASSRYFDRLLACAPNDNDQPGRIGPKVVLSLFHEIAAGNMGKVTCGT
jgi:hypothetical protein